MLALQGSTKRQRVYRVAEVSTSEQLKQVAAGVQVPGGGARVCFGASADVVPLLLAERDVGETGLPGMSRAAGMSTAVSSVRDPCRGPSLITHSGQRDCGMCLARSAAAVD
ncbi:hypothetical protein ABNF97_30155 [Plantactinospora sp. B6F1]|uniref:hypothetical protein n=1 Tax=Plantactinospora sp. B6F1 TaxID=3158971 RepID=UPI0032D8BF43